MQTTLSSNGISSFDIRSMVMTSSNNGDDMTEGSPDHILTVAHAEASKIEMDEKFKRLLN